MSQNLPQPSDPGYVDLLDEDKPLAGQKFACLSFVSPENVIKHKLEFFFDEFIKQWELSKSMEKFTKFLAFLSHKYHLSLEDLNEDLGNFSEVEKDDLFQNSLTLNDEYRTFVDNNEAKLQELYDKANQFTTSTRGLKVRGCFPTLQEAELKAKTLRAVDKNHDIMVGPVGVWLPFDPEAYKTGRTEYLEAELNQLMHEKKKNEAKASNEFASRIKETKEQAMKDNVEKAEASGNKLTQKLDKEGNLMSVSDVSTFEDNFDSNKEVSAEEVRDKLFNSDNVVPPRQERTVVDIGEEEASTTQEEASTTQEEASTTTEEASTATEEAPSITEEASTTTEEASTSTEEASTTLEEASTTQEEVATLQEEAATLQEEVSTTLEEASTLQEEASTLQEEASTLQEEVSTATEEDA